MSDSVNNPAHYTVYPVETIEIVRHLGFCLGNATKYILRAPYKNGLEDCDKATRYLEMEREIPQPPLIHHEYECSRNSSRRLVHFLLHAGGDMLFGDVAICQLDYLDGLGSYLLYLDMRYPGKMRLEALDKMLNSVRDLRRILEIRDRQGDIYDGMSGWPKEEKEWAR